MLGFLACLAPVLAILDITVFSGGHLGDYHAPDALYLSRAYPLCLSAFAFGLLAYKGRSFLEDIFSCMMGVLVLVLSYFGRAWHDAQSPASFIVFMLLLLSYAFLCCRIWGNSESKETAGSRRRFLLFCASGYGCVFSFMLFVLFVYEFHVFCPLGGVLLMLMHWFMCLGWLVRGGLFGSSRGISVFV